jgi:hypothetical protein
MADNNQLLEKIGKLIKPLQGRQGRIEKRLDNLEQ